MLKTKQFFVFLIVLILLTVTIKIYMQEPTCKGTRELSPGSKVRFIKVEGTGTMIKDHRVVVSNTSGDLISICEECNNLDDNFCIKKALKCARDLKRL